MQRQHGDRGRQAHPLGFCRHMAEDELGAGENAERIEMMLADPDRMHAELLGVQRFGGDVGDELVGRAGIVLVVIVAKRKVTKLHVLLLAPNQLQISVSRFSAKFPGRYRPRA